MKTMKMMAIVLGTALFVGGCVGDLLSNLVTALPISIATEYLTDNDGIFDLFAD